MSASVYLILLLDFWHIYSVFLWVTPVSFRFPEIRTCRDRDIKFYKAGKAYSFYLRINNKTGWIQRSALCISIFDAFFAFSKSTHKLTKNKCTDICSCFRSSIETGWRFFEFGKHATNRKLLPKKIELYTFLPST